MTAQDFRAIAEMLAELKQVADATFDGRLDPTYMIESVTDNLARRNPRFDRDRFRRACGLTHFA